MDDLGIKLVKEFFNHPSGKRGLNGAESKIRVRNTTKSYGKDLLGFFWFGHGADTGDVVVGGGLNGRDVVGVDDFRDGLNHRLWFVYFNTCFTGRNCRVLDPEKNWAAGVGNHLLNSLVSQYGTAYASEGKRVGNQVGDGNLPGYGPPHDHAPEDNSGPFEPDYMVGF